MLRPWPVRSMCCCRNHFLLFFIFFGHVMATAKIQPQEMNLTSAIWGLANWFQGFLKDTRPTIWPQQKNIQAQEMKMWGFEPENWSQGLVSPYLAAAGRQTNQPQEMRIWGLGWRNCSREFSGTCAPLSGRSRPPKNPATGNENLSLAKLSEIPTGTFFIVWAFRPRNCEQKFGTDSLVL